MKAVSTREMQRMDQLAIRRFGIPSIILMENVGRGIAELAESMVKRGGRVLVICGKGNNGGDGLVAARHLVNRGFCVEVVLLARARDLKDDPKINFNILSRMRVPVEIITSARKLPRLYELIRRSRLLIDAIFGIGLVRPVDGLFYAVIQAMNDSRKNILAVDVPSGLQSDTGKVLGTAVRAQATGTLGAPKRGLFRGAGPKHSGKITVLDISIPSLLIANQDVRFL